jgi:hypothetical protein
LENAQGCPKRPAVHDLPTPAAAEHRSDLGDAKAATAISGRLHESLSGELLPHAGVSITNVLLSPDFMRLRAELLRVLARYPEARDAISSPMLASRRSAC